MPVVGHTLPASSPASPLPFGFGTSSVHHSCQLGRRERNAESAARTYIDPRDVYTHPLRQLALGIAGGFVLLLELAFEDLHLTLGEPRFAVVFLGVASHGHLIHVCHGSRSAWHRIRRMRIRVENVFVVIAVMTERRLEYLYAIVVGQELHVGPRLATARPAASEARLIPGPAARLSPKLRRWSPEEVGRESDGNRPRRGRSCLL